MTRNAFFTPSTSPSRSILRLVRRTHSALLLLALLVLPVASAAAQPVETSPLDPESELASSGVAGPAPGRGFVAAWGRGKQASGAFGHPVLAADRVMALWLGPDGTPLTPIQELDQPDDEIFWPLAVASAAVDEAVIVLTTTFGIETRRFRFDGSPPEPLQPVTPCLTLGTDAELVAAGSGYWLAWYESCDGRTILGRRLDLSGAPQGEAVEIAGPQDEPKAGVGIAAAQDGGFWVAWDRLGANGREIVARRYGPDGAPATEPVVLRSFFRDHTSILYGPDVTPLPGGGARVAWEDRTGRIFLRSLDAEGALQGPPIQASDAPAIGENRPQIAASGLGVSAAAWSRATGAPAASPCVLRLFDTVRPEVGEETTLDEPCSEVDELVFEAGGSLLVLSSETLLLADSPFGAYSRTRIAVLPASETVHPPGPGFVSQAAPGFRFWVRIGGDEPEPRTGQPEPACIPETACVSGAVPGRSEVFVRVVGPKGNGYLWPTIVRFTTSTVEVWIEQVATGALRYYHLDGAEPDSSDLTGGFDRMGFVP